MTTINVIYNGTSTPVVLESLTPQTAPLGYLYNRVTQDLMNALVVTNSYVTLEAVLEAGLGDDFDDVWADRPGAYLRFADASGDYSKYAPFTQAKLTATRYYYSAAASGTNIANLFIGNAISVPAVLALNTASGTIPSGVVSGTITPPAAYFQTLLNTPPNDSQKPRLLWGLVNNAANDDISGARFPSNITTITVF